ncbi:phosphate ABC transporter permease subunit PstC [Mangrovicella endophytica]|uniref:phosphate ABC transporter permease subunit PstC n=1 Tax=Mangrovicella endophytica TaxID=2066697 RepID=UPI000C9DDF7E|nr:phosphate ABC transporter permease subunit PstC [Mangrovicella endophytica]
MSTSAIIAIVLLIAAVGFTLGYRKSQRLAAGSAQKAHSRAVYHGMFVVSWALIPSLILLAGWLIASPALIAADIHADMPEAIENGTNPRLAYQMVEGIGAGLRALPADEQDAAAAASAADLRAMFQRRGIMVASASEDYMVELAVKRNRLEDYSRIAMSAVVILLAVAGAAYGLSQIAVRLRARNQVERVVGGILVLASSIAILTTVGIIFSMLFETIDFFGRVSPTSFFFGTVWDPGFAAAGADPTVGQFGLIPLLAGTLYIAFVAMLVAVPIGLFAAIYMSEYASRGVRSTVKPLLELLAGIPTIVYGFFALVTVGPFLRDMSAQLNGLITGNYQNFIQAQSVITAGIVMGVMLIPFVSSLSDDIITAVPRSLRDGSFGLGATRSETVKRVILPAALPGIVSALLLTASRAIGETMIVVLAAGVAARLTLNPFEAMTTVTVKIVNQLTGDLEFNSPQTLVAFALGITLFAITLCLNIIALVIVRKYREAYE